jgi:hypothetical protein
MEMPEYGFENLIIKSPIIDIIRCILVQCRMPLRYYRLSISHEEFGSIRDDTHLSTERNAPRGQISDGFGSEPPVMELQRFQESRKSKRQSIQTHTIIGGQKRNFSQVL